MQAAADPQRAGQAVHVDSLTNYQNAISIRKLTLLTTFEILYEVYEISFKEIIVFKKCLRAFYFIKAYNRQKGLNLILCICIKTEREREREHTCEFSSAGFMFNSLSCEHKPSHYSLFTASPPFKDVHMLST